MAVPLSIHALLRHNLTSSSRRAESKSGQGPPFCAVSFWLMLLCSPQGCPEESQFVLVEDSSQGQPPTTTNHQPPTANRQPPPTANRQPPTAPNRQLPTTTSHQPRPTIVQFCFCGLVSCPCLDHEADSVPVDVLFCCCYERFSFLFFLDPTHAIARGFGETGAKPFGRGYALLAPTGFISLVHAVVVAFHTFIWQRQGDGWDQGASPVTLRDKLMYRLT